MPDGEPVSCPFCKSTQTELIALFGSQLLTSQYRCTACGSYFEALRPDSEEATVSHGRCPQH
jgi:transposase-like protein